MFANQKGEGCVEFVFGLLLVCGLILLAVYALSGLHLTAPTGGGPSAEGINLFLKTLGL